jgi:putative ABC transport system ATP-binding protein
MSVPGNSQIIKTNVLSRIYEKGNIKVIALLDVSFEVSEGQFICIAGKSGSGKSTLLNLIGGLDRPSSGNIFFNGNDLAGMNRYELALHRRLSVGMIFQSFNLVPTLSALDNVILPLIFSGINSKLRKSKGVELLRQVGLENRKDHFPGELSGGEAQRVAIARALANEPRVILADEPTGNLDSQTSEEIINVLVSLNKDKGLTILMVTHDLETAERISDKIIRLKDGKIVEEMSQKNKWLNG